MAVKLTYVKDETYELRPPTAIDHFAAFVSPSGAESNVVVIDGRVAVTLSELGVWSCVWPSETAIEIEVILPLADVVQDALAADVPVSSLSSRPA